MASNERATQRATVPGGGGSKRVYTLADLPETELRRVAARLPAEQGGRIAALVQELRGGRNHVDAVVSSANSDATATRDAEVGAAAPAVSRSAGMVGEDDKAALDLDIGTATHDALVELKSAAAPAVSSSAGMVDEDDKAGLDNGTASHEALVGFKAAAAPAVSSSSGKVGEVDKVSKEHDAQALIPANLKPDASPDALRSAAQDFLDIEQNERTDMGDAEGEQEGDALVGFKAAAVSSSAEKVGEENKGSTGHDAPAPIPAELKPDASPADAILDIEQNERTEKDEEGEEEGIDRLSDLPNDVLCDIVGRLPVRQAARTRILSRRWHALSTWLPRRSLAAEVFAEMETSDEDEDAELDQADLISGLPDDILCLILSRVPLLEAVRTSVLACRWREVWIRLPIVILDDAAMRDAGVVNFIDLVDAVVLKQCDSKIRELMVRITNEGNLDGARLAAWTSRAAERVGGALTFDLDFGGDYLQRHTVLEMPNQAMAESISVYVSHPQDILFRVRKTAGGHFARLTRLDLVGANFRDTGGRSISELVSHDCPLLKRLRLEDVREVLHLDISSSSLTELVAVFVTDIVAMKIEAINLINVHLGHCFLGKENTAMSLIASTLKVIIWDDLWPATSDLSTVGGLQELKVYRRQNSENLQTVIRHFRQVETLSVIVSAAEDVEVVKIELAGMRLPHSELRIQLSENEDEE